MFATLSPKDEEVIRSGEEDVFLLYVVSHIFLGAMMKWHTRIGSYFFPESLKAIREEMGLDPVLLPYIMAALGELGYVKNGIVKQDGKPVPYSSLTVKGQTNMAIWSYMAQDLAFELITAWRQRWGHYCKVCATRPGYRYCPNCLGGKKVTPEHGKSTDEVMLSLFGRAS